jgi:hypothetical protein
MTVLVAKLGWLAALRILLNKKKKDDSVHTTSVGIGMD